jgi:hypothetical protein
MDDDHQAAGLTWDSYHGNLSMENDQEELAGSTSGDLSPARAPLAVSTSVHSSPAGHLSIDNDQGGELAGAPVVVSTSRDPPPGNLSLNEGVPEETTLRENASFERAGAQVKPIILPVRSSPRFVAIAASDVPRASPAKKRERGPEMVFGELVWPREKRQAVAMTDEEGNTSVDEGVPARTLRSSKKTKKKKSVATTDPLVFDIGSLPESAGGSGED